MTTLWYRNTPLSIQIVIEWQRCCCSGWSVYFFLSKTLLTWNLGSTIVKFQFLLQNRGWIKRGKLRSYFQNNFLRSRCHMNINLQVVHIENTSIVRVVHDINFTLSLTCLILEILFSYNSITMFCRICYLGISFLI